MLIDFHTHCFPDKIAAKAVAKLAHASGGLMPGTDTPWHTPEMELRLPDSLEIDSGDREKILYGNARRLLGLDT